MAVSISLVVNGEEHKVDVEPWWSLAYVLREKLGLTGTKIMCNNGACGSYKRIVQCILAAAEMMRGGA